MLRFIRKLIGFSGQNGHPIHPKLAEMLEPGDTPGTLESVIAQLESNSIDDRRNAAYALGDYDHPIVCTKLLELIHDPDVYVRTYSIQSLGRRGDTVAVYPLCDLLTKGDADSLVCSNAIRVLAGLRDPRALKTLLQLLTSEDAFVRYDAAYALGEIGHHDAIPQLQSILTDDTMPESFNDNGGTSTAWSVGENAQKAIDKIRAANT